MEYFANKYKAGCGKVRTCRPGNV